MNFDFSDEQKELRDQAQRFLKEQCDTTVPRRILESEEPYARDLWQKIVELGWPAAALPEQYGGIGFGYLELCVIAEELGRALAPVPYSSTVYLAAEAILLAGSDQQKSELLPKLGAGEAIGTLAFAEGPGTPTALDLKTSFDGTTLNGTKVPVPDGDVADFAIVAARQDDGVSLAIVDLKADGVEREAIATVDPTRSHARLKFTGAAAEPLGPAGGGWPLLQKVLDRAAVLMAFEQVGGASAALDMARGFAVERYAFGRPIGSFQAIKHKLADMYVNNEIARSNAYYGAWALNSDAPELALAAATARVAATEAYHYAAKENIQTHGGMGFTWEADCHLYYRRSKLLGLALGGLPHWKERLVTELERQRQGKPAPQPETQPVG